MNITRVQVRRIGAGEDPSRWAAALADPAWLTDSRTLKEDGRAWVRRATLLGQGVVVKSRPAASARERLKSILGASRSDRHWRGAQWLIENGFATATPVLLAVAEVDGIRSELLVTEFVNARSVLEHLAANDLPVREQHALARALAALLVGMFQRRRYNRDGKPSNLLVVRNPAGPPTVVTIDTVAIRRIPPRKLAYLVRMLSNLAIEAIGTGHTPRRTLQAGVIHSVGGRLSTYPTRQLVRDLWQLTRQRVRRHADPRPRIDPIPQQSRLDA